MNSLDDEVAKVIPFPAGDAAIPVRNGSATIRPDTADPKALEIGRIFRRGTAAQFETGKLLLERKAELKLERGKWLPWLEQHRDVLGFDRRTAQRLMKLASENASLTTLLLAMGADEIREINQDVWGNKKPARREDRDFYRTPMATVRLAALLMDQDNTGVTFKWKDYRLEGADRYKTMTLAVGEFIRRFLMHVLPKRFHRIRHYGLFANGARADNIARARELLKMAAADKPASANTDDLLHSHRCPCCGGRMIIIETFERGTTPRTRPSTLALAIGFDSS